MDLRQLIEALSERAAYPDPVSAVEVRQTHISVVFLAVDALQALLDPRVST